jgi:hypothetical protein
VRYCESYSDLIPLSFVLGFYVSIVMQRWWNQYVSIPWPDSIAVFVSSNIHGQVHESGFHSSFFFFLPFTVVSTDLGALPEQSSANDLVTFSVFCVT